MTRKTFVFIRWCNIATCRIYYGPDRKVVFHELMEHLEDAYDAAIARDFSEEDAIQYALNSIGKATDVAAQLAAIHRPFWGFVIRGCQILLAILVVLSLLPIVQYVKDLRLEDDPSLLDFNAYDPASYSESAGRVLEHLSKPNLSFSTDAGTFTITDVVVYTTPGEEEAATSAHLFLQIEQRTLLPWAEQHAHIQPFSVTAYFTARDSLGNEYPCYWDGRSGDLPYINSHTVQRGIFTGAHELWIYEFPQEAQWVELCYLRDGRNHMVRIDLTGGDHT